jgi:hypothetical protein
MVKSLETGRERTMARTTSLTVGYKATVRMAKYEPVEIFHSETVELEPGDRSGEVRSTLHARVKGFVEANVLALRRHASREEREAFAAADGGFAIRTDDERMDRERAAPRRR